MTDPLLTHRTESWRIELLDRDDAPAGELDGVAAGNVEHNINRVLHSGGALETHTRTPPDWLDLRVRLWWHVAPSLEWPLGTFICVVPGEQYTDTGSGSQVTLLDKLTILDQDGISATYSLPAGTVVTDAVKTLITDAGETSLAVTASAETLSSGMVWEAGTSRLRIINDLLAAINYFALRTDAYGRFTASPYTRPGDRAVLRDITADAIVLSEWSREQDFSRVPNRVVLVGQGTGDTEALVGVAENTDPASRLSIPRRGRVVTVTETGVEATSQAVINGLAARRLADLSTPAATRTISHAAVPLALHDVIRHRGVDGAVQSWAMALEVGALMRTTLREVTS